MITVSADFKEAVKQPVKQIKAYLNDGIDNINESDDLKHLKIVGNSSLCKAIMRQAEATFLGSHSYLGSEVNLGIGVMIADIVDKGVITLSIADPVVVSLASHGLNIGNRIKLSTTGALPTGLLEDTTYYVVPIVDEETGEEDPDTFNLAETYNDAMLGNLIATSGSQSGTHSMNFYPDAIGSTAEYIDYGSFIVTKEDTDIGSGETTVKMFDKMHEALIPYDLEPTYPITIKEMIEAICTRFSWTLGTATFPNDDYELSSDPFIDQEISFRDALQALAEATGSLIYFDSSDELIVRQISSSSLETLDAHNLFNFSKETEYGELNSIALASTPIETNNIVQQDETSIGTYGLNEFKIINNLLMIDDTKKTALIGEIYTALVGIKYYPFEAETEGLGYFEIGDRITIKDLADVEREVLIFDIEIEVDGTLRETLSAPIPEKATTAYEYAGIIGKTIKDTQIIVDKVQGEIIIINETLSTVSSIPRQAEAPESPSTNDLWLDTDDNIIYIYDGADWQPTSISPSSLDGYYTSEETEVAINLSKDEIITSVEAVSTTANQALALADANSDDIATVQSSLTEITQRADEIDIKIEGIGGINLLKNSSGLKGSIEEWQLFDEDGDLVDATNTGTVLQTSDIEENTESGSAIRIEEGYITQTFATLIGNQYTFYVKFNKFDDISVYISGIAEAIPLTAEDYTDETWAIFKYIFTASDTTTTIKIESLEVGGYAILADMVCKLGDVTAWSQAPNEVYGKGFRFDKDGFSITSLTDAFKSILDNVKLGVYDTSSGVDRLIMEVSKDRAKLTKLTAQEEFIIQRYDNSSKSARFIPTSTGMMLVIND